MKKIQIIILDFDGTLADTAPVIIQTMQATHQKLGLPQRSEQDCSSMIGLRLVDIPKILFPGYEITGELYAETYRKLFYSLNEEGSVRHYPHVKSTLHKLKEKGITLTVASSRSHASLVSYLEKLELAPFISYILGADDVKHGKPHPEAVQRTLAYFHLEPEEAVVVGDTEYDIQMGQAAGTLTCGVTYGNGSPQSLAQAHLLIERFDSLLQIIEAS